MNENYKQQQQQQKKKKGQKKGGKKRDLLGNLRACIEIEALHGRVDLQTSDVLSINRERERENE